MPRDGSNVYHRPSGIDAVTNTTISSVAYNTNVQDVEADLNLARPIVAGGTGANNAAQAMQNLGGELAKQSVSNYDATVFQAGSFYSATSATGAPVAGHAFNGICYVTDANNMTIEARDATNGNKYARQMTAGVWGSWSPDSGGGQFVLKAGDTMTGNLKIASATDSLLNLSPAAGSAQVLLNKTASGNSNLISGYMNTAARWAVQLGNTSAESGSNAGSNFEIDRYNDAGVVIDSPLSINRATGNVSTGNNLYVGGELFIQSSSPGMEIGNMAGAASSPFIDFHSSGNVNDYDCRIISSGGAATVGQGALTFLAGQTVVSGGPLYGTLVARANYPNFSLTIQDTGTFYTKNIRVSNTATLEIINHANTAILHQLDDGGNCTYLGLVSCKGRSGRQGINNAANGSAHNWFWTGSATQMWVDASNIGIVALSSDYRIKKDVIDLPGMWDTVKALRPIKYTQAQFTPPAQIDSNKQVLADHLARVDEAKAKSEPPPPDPIIPPMPMYPADDIERWGFIAHELQETLIENAATGVKDSPDTVQSPNPWTVIAALTKALQEAMTRIEALEAR